MPGFDRIALCKEAGVIFMPLVLPRGKNFGLDKKEVYYLWSYMRRN